MNPVLTENICKVCICKVWKKVKMKVKSLSRVWLFVTSWTVAYQASPSMGFFRQEYWSGLPFPPPGDLPDPGIEPRSPALEADTLTSEPPGIFLMCCWVLINRILLRNLCSSVILACSSLFLWHVFQVLVLGWWWPHRLSLEVYLPLQFSGKVC